MNAAILIAASVTLAWPGAATAADNKSGNLDRLWIEVRGPGLQASTIKFDAKTISPTSVNVSPDGNTIIFSVLGDIYALPTSGGVARLIHGGPSWDTAPSYSPDGRNIAFISDIDGGDQHIWIMRASGGRATKVDTVPVHAFGWGSHSNEIYFTEKVSYTGRAGPLYRMNITSGKRSLVAGSFDLLTMNGASADRRGDRATFLSDKLEIMLFEPRKGFVTRALTGLPFTWKSSPVMSPDGRQIAFLALDGADGSDGRPNIHLFTYDVRSHAASLVTTWQSDSPFPTEDGRVHLTRLAFGHNGKVIFAYMNGGIHKVDLARKSADQIPLQVPVSIDIKRPIERSTSSSQEHAQTRVARWASMPDRADKIVFQAAGKIWWRDQHSEIVHRLTNSTDLEYSPAISPDGSNVVYVTIDENDQSRLMIAPVSAGGVPRSLETGATMYASPEWTPDGEEIIFIRDDNKRPSLANTLGLYDTDGEIRRISVDGRKSEFITSISLPAFSWERTVFKLAAVGDPLRIFFTNEGPGSGGAGRQLVSVNIDGSERKTHLVFKDHMFGALPSPDGRRFVVSTRYQNWILGPEELDVNSSTDYKALKQKAFRIDNIGASYDSLRWGANGVTWSFGGKFYKWKSPSENLEVTAISAPVYKDNSGTSVAYVNARIVTSSQDRVIDRGTVLVKGNRIVRVISEVPGEFSEGTVIVDLQGKTIIPGLINTHSHIFENSEYHPRQDEQLVGHLAYGITTIFEPAGHLIGNLARGEAIEAGEVLGPRLFTAGPQFQEPIHSWNESEEEIPDALGGTSVLQRATSMSDAREVVDALAAAGAAMVKTRGLVRRDEMMWIGASSARAGIPATAHIEHRAEAANFTAIVDGFKALEHYDPKNILYEDEVGFYGQTRAFLTPTHVTPYYSSVCNEIQGIRSLENGKERRFGFYEGAADRWDTIVSMDTNHHLKENNLVAAQFKRLTDAGAILALGVETTKGGLSPHCTMWALVHGGYSPLEAIKIATINSARKIGKQNDIGSIEDGKLADFLILNSNPLEDIKRTADIRYVVFNGRVYDGETLTELFPKYSALRSPRWVNPADWSNDKSQVAPLLRQR